MNLLIYAAVVSYVCGGVLIGVAAVYESTALSLTGVGLLAATVWLGLLVERQVQRELKRKP